MIKYKQTAAVLLAIAGILSGGPAAAEGDAARGADIGYSCLGCHGIEGYRNAYPSYRVPKLGGQTEAYLVAALKGYKSGMRKHATMQAQASSLSDQEIEDVAAYFVSVADVTLEPGSGNASNLDAAATCVACHGDDGIGLSPTWPTLAGQHEDYLVHALKQYRSRERSDAVMAPMAAGLSDADIKLLAKYYAQKSGLVTTLLN